MLRPSFEPRAAGSEREYYLCAMQPPTTTVSVAYFAHLFRVRNLPTTASNNSSTAMSEEEIQNLPEKEPGNITKPRKLRRGTSAGRAAASTSSTCPTWPP